MNKGSMHSTIKGENTGLTSIFSFVPIENEDEKTLGDRKLSGTLMGVMNMPIVDGEFVIVKKEDMDLHIPIIDNSEIKTVQESVDEDMKRKINATGTTEVLGWLTIGYEFKGQRSIVGEIIVTVFKIDEMGDFTPSESCEQMKTQTLEMFAQAFDDSPIDFGDENIFVHMAEIALNS